MILACDNNTNSLFVLAGQCNAAGQPAALPKLGWAGLGSVLLCP